MYSCRWCVRSRNSYHKFSLSWSSSMLIANVPSCSARFDVSVSFLSHRIVIWVRSLSHRLIWCYLRTRHIRVTGITIRVSCHRAGRREDTASRSISSPHHHYTTSRRNGELSTLLGCSGQRISCASGSTPPVGIALFFYPRCHPYVKGSPCNAACTQMNQPRITICGYQRKTAWISFPARYVIGMSGKRQAPFAWWSVDFTSRSCYQPKRMVINCIGGLKVRLLAVFHRCTSDWLSTELCLFDQIMICIRVILLDQEQKVE